MRIGVILKALPLLPASWVSALLQTRRPLAQRQERAERWSRFLLKYLGCRLIVEGAENVPTDRTVYFVSNHQGTLDPVPLLASCPVHLSFISKKENEKLPFFGRWARLIGTIHFDRSSREGNVHMLREAARRLKDGHNLLIFPEGTRSRGDRMHDFKDGSLLPAYLSRAVIVPVTLRNSYVLDSRTDRNRDITVIYGEPIPYEQYRSIDREDFARSLHDQIQSRIEISPEER